MPGPATADRAESRQGEAPRSSTADEFQHVCGPGCDGVHDAKADMNVDSSADWSAPEDFAAYAEGPGESPGAYGAESAYAGASGADEFQHVCGPSCDGVHDAKADMNVESVVDSAPEDFAAYAQGPGESVGGNREESGPTAHVESRSEAESGFTTKAEHKGKAQAAEPSSHEKWSTSNSNDGYGSYDQRRSDHRSDREVRSDPYQRTGETQSPAFEPSFSKSSPEQSRVSTPERSVHQERAVSSEVTELSKGVRSATATVHAAIEQLIPREAAKQVVSSGASGNNEGPRTTGVSLLQSQLSKLVVALQESPLRSAGIEGASRTLQIVTKTLSVTPPQGTTLSTLKVVELALRKVAGELQTVPVKQSESSLRQIGRRAENFPLNSGFTSKAGSNDRRENPVRPSSVRSDPATSPPNQNQDRRIAGTSRAASVPMTRVVNNESARYSPRIDNDPGRNRAMIGKNAIDSSSSIRRVPRSPEILTGKVSRISASATVSPRTNEKMPSRLDAVDKKLRLNRAGPETAETRIKTGELRVSKSNKAPSERGMSTSVAALGRSKNGAPEQGNLEQKSRETPTSTRSGKNEPAKRDTRSNPPRDRDTRRKSESSGDLSDEKGRIRMSRISNEASSRRGVRDREVSLRRINSPSERSSRVLTRVRQALSRSRIELREQDLFVPVDLQRRLEELEEQLLEHALRSSRPSRATTRELLRRAKKLRASKAAKALEARDRTNKADQSSTGTEPKESATKEGQGIAKKVAAQPKVRDASQTPSKSLNTVLAKVDDGDQGEDEQV